MKSYFYRNEEETHGPVSEKDIHELRRVGKITDTTLLIEEFTEAWQEYRKAFWVPPVVPFAGNAEPALDRTNRPTGVSTLSAEGGNLGRINWLDARMLADCPACGAAKRIKARDFYYGTRRCQACSVTTQRSNWANPREENEGQIYKRSLVDLLFNYKGRLNIRSFWLIWIFGIFLPLVGIGLLGSGLRDVAMISYLIFAICFLAPPSITKRSQDAGRRQTILGCLYLGISIPLFLMLDAFRKSEPKANRFGPPPSRINL